MTLLKMCLTMRTRITLHTILHHLLNQITIPGGGSNFTPSFAPTGSMDGLGNSGVDIDPSTNEGDVEEVVGGVAIGAKKWTAEEDQRLIRTSINMGTDTVSGLIRRSLMSRLGLPPISMTIAPRSLNTNLTYAQWL